MAPLHHWDGFMDDRGPSFTPDPNGVEVPFINPCSQYSPFPLLIHAQGPNDGEQYISVSCRVVDWYDMLYKDHHRYPAHPVSLLVAVVEDHLHQRRGMSYFLWLYLFAQTDYQPLHSGWLAGSPGVLE